LRSNLEIIYKIIVFLAILFVAFLISCNDVNYNYMSGTLTDMVTGEPIANAKVEFEITEIVSGSFYSAFSPFKETYTDEQGNYLIEFESRNFVKMKMIFAKDDFHTVSTIFDPEGVGYDYVVDEIIPKESYISFKIHNSVPYSNDDVLKLRILNINEDCDVCAGSDYRYFYGDLVDTVIVCKVVGGESVTVNYISIHDDIPNIVENQVYCTPSDTVMYNCYY